MKRPVPVVMRANPNIIKKDDPVELRKLLKRRQVPGDPTGGPMVPKTLYKRPQGPWRGIESAEDVEYKIHKVKIGFKADARNPDAVKLPGGTNFAYMMYQALFSTVSAVPKYFYYHVDLKQDGSPVPDSDRVFMSDADFKPARPPEGLRGRVRVQGEDIVPATDEESEEFAKSVKAGSDLLQGPDLDPSKRGVPTVYRNLMEGQQKTYQQEEYIRIFVTSGKYVIPGMKSKDPEKPKELTDPLKGGGLVGAPIGLEYPEKEEKKMASKYRMAVKAAMEKQEDGAQTGGFDIMQQVAKHPPVPIKKQAGVSEQVDEARAFAKKQDPGADDFDVEAALWWYGNDYHGGQGSWQYSLVSTSKFKPSPLHNKVDQEGDVAKMIYDALVDKYEKKGARHG